MRVLLTGGGGFISSHVAERLLERGHEVAVVGQTRDYVFVEDVARANVLAVEAEAPNGAYNVGTGVETNVNELYEKLRAISDKELPPEHGPAKPGEQARSCVDPSKAQKLLDWGPKVGLEAGLAETLRFFGAA